LSQNRATDRNTRHGRIVRPLARRDDLERRVRRRVTVVLLVLAGATTWASDGFWAADGAYSHFVVPILGLAWVTVASGFLTRQLASAREPQRAAVSQF
jgi:hypothetical protein